MAIAARLRAALLAIAALGGCGDTPAALALRGEPTVVAEPSAAQGPALLLSAPRRATLAPVAQTGSRRLWRSGGSLALATEGARVVATAGLSRMVMATRFDDEDPLEDPRALLDREATARRTVDLAAPDRDPRSMRFGLALSCTLRGRGEGGWVVVEERCGGGDIAFTNRFWADPATGVVRRSEQWAGEGVMLSIETRGV